ncbi:hypothetical protein [Ruminococcus champanellensis]|uniref:hypothetical protein n=1 Tax=Ruminococcus champanellensis TaxID=1161942 RepID=UPI00248BC529|nr:hypothetical protein [Ruminococcus champanellensis]
MNTRKLLSGAAALALLCSAGSCGQNESEQTHAQVQQNSGTSDISATDAPVNTEPVGTAYTASVTTTAVSTTSVPGTQPQFCVTTNPPVSTCEPQGNPRMEQAQTKPDPSANWQEALEAEIETWGGETFRTGLGSTTFRGTTYGFEQRAVSETTYEYIFFSVDQNNQGKILKRWTDIRPHDSLYANYSMYFCNGKFYLHKRLRFKKYQGDECQLEIYDASGTRLQAYTMPQFYGWFHEPAENALLFSDDLITVCGSGCILTHEYKTRDAYDRMHYFYLIDPYTGEKTALPPPKDGAFGFFQCGQPVQPLLVDGVYQNKLYVTCVDAYEQKTGYWYDLNAGEWHALDVELSNSANASISKNYAIGRFLFTKGRIYDMETDQFLPDVPEGAIPSDPNSLLDPDRTLTVNDTGVYLQQDDGTNTAILEWD